MNYNYFNFELKNGKYLITNDFGNWVFLDSEDFQRLVHKKVEEGSELANKLEEKGFIFYGSRLQFIEKNYPLIRNAKNYVFTAPSLHIIVVTTYCNVGCLYCQAGCSGDIRPKHMDVETALQSAQLVLQSKADCITVEFQGGEPLLNFPVIQKVVNFIEENKGNKMVNYTIVSNLTSLKEEMIDFIINNNISISTSIDGPKELHDLNRPFPSGFGSFKKMAEGFSLLKEHGIHPGAIQTTTRFSLVQPENIVKTYVEFGLSSLFIRALTPLGAAAQRWDQIGYSTTEYTKFYREALKTIIEANLNGSYIEEGHASIFLSKILAGFPQNYMELRSPCGAGLGQLCYYVDGTIFTCDEGRMAYEMGDDSFAIGHVQTSTPSDLASNRNCHATSVASVLECLPGCSTCVYQPFCGVCPVINHALYGDLVAKEHLGYRCKIYKGMLDTIFDLLQEKDPKVMQIFQNWCEKNGKTPK